MGVHVGPVSGNPENIGIDMKPSSFGYFGINVWDWNFGEHGLGEPGARAPDYAYRKQASIDFTAGKYNSMLFGKWWPKCKCFFYDEALNGK